MTRHNVQAKLDDSALAVPSVAISLCCIFHLLHILVFLLRLITQLRFNISRCVAKIQIFSQTNVKMLRLFLNLQQFNVFNRLSAIISPIISCKSKDIPHIMQSNFVNASIHFTVRPRTCSL